MQSDMRQITTEQMKQYLWHAMQFEKYVYIWTKAMDAVNTQMKDVHTEQNRMKHRLREIDYERERVEEKYSKKIKGDRKRAEELEERIKICKKRRPKFLLLAMFFAVLAVWALVFVVTEAAKGDTEAGEWAAVGTLLFVGLMAPTILFAVRFLVDGKKIKSAIIRIPELQVTCYDEKVTDEQAKLVPHVENVNYKLQKLALREEALTAHQERVFMELQNAKKVRSNIYALGFLHRDYHDFVAVSTMYGYLDRGRCTTLMGPGGIYDTFEKDLQMQTVIRNLQDLNTSMERVEANQRVLINEMRIANQHLASMDRSLNNIEDYSRQAAQNTAMIAVSSQQAAAELKWQSYQVWANS